MIRKVEKVTRTNLTVLLVLRENLADVDVVSGVARHREAIVLVVHDALHREVLIANNGFLQVKDCEKKKTDHS